MGFSTSAGQSEIERACDQLYEKAESIDYRYDVQDETVEGLLILPLYGSMPTGNQQRSAVLYTYRNRNAYIDIFLMYWFSFASIVPEQQKQIFEAPPKGIRKCVVATNIAATSLTIDGIR